MKVAIEAEDDPQHRALAAAGRSDQHADLAGTKREFDRREHLVRFARGTPERFAGNIDLKPHGDATYLRVSQTAAPAPSR